MRVITHTPYEPQWNSLQPVKFYSELIKVTMFAGKVIFILTAGICFHFNSIRLF